VPRDEQLIVPERHLGLLPNVESERSRDYVHAAGDCVIRRLDLEQLLQLARPALGNGHCAPQPSYHCPEADAHNDGDRPVIAVARDEAFQFTYEDNLDLLRAAGATIAYFSPLRDSSLPARTAGIILSGGFPEVHAARLAANTAMHHALREAHGHGLPIYAECGGLMYLTQSIHAPEGTSHPMVGLLPGHCVMADRLTLGYRVVRSVGPSWFLHEGETVRGHEFHYSTWSVGSKQVQPACFVLPRAETGDARTEGACVGSLWASYIHIHFGARPELAARFVAACSQVVVGAMP
jgi:cobyrinic acid a,c-diamide synthase